MIGQRNQRKQADKDLLSDIIMRTGSQIGEQVFASQEAEKERAARKELQQSQQASDLDRLQKEHENQMALNEQEDTLYRETYDSGPETWTDSLTGNVYTWDSNTIRDIEYQRFLQDRAAYNMRVKDALDDDDDEKSRNELTDKYLFLRQQTMSDYQDIWNGTSWTGIPTPEIADKSKRTFDGLVRSMLLSGEISSNEAEWMISEFDDYISNAVSGASTTQSDQQRQPSRFAQITQETINAMPYTGNVIADLPKVLGQAGQIGETLGERSATREELQSQNIQVPPGVQDREVVQWDALRRMIQSLPAGQDRDKAIQEMQALEEQGFIGIQRMQQIIDFLARPQQTGRGF